MFCVCTRRCWGSFTLAQRVPRLVLYLQSLLMLTTRRRKSLWSPLMTCLSKRPKPRPRLTRWWTSSPGRTWDGGAMWSLYTPLWRGCQISVWRKTLLSTTGFWMYFLRRSLCPVTTSSECLITIPDSRSVEFSCWSRWRTMVSACHTVQPVCGSPLGFRETENRAAHTAHPLWMTKKYPSSYSNTAVSV